MRPRSPARLASQLVDLGQPSLLLVDAFPIDHSFKGGFGNGSEAVQWSLPEPPRPAIVQPTSLAAVIMQDSWHPARRSRARVERRVGPVAG